jgi:hypothetical protein
MNDLFIESNVPKDWGNSLHLLTEATDKMARQRCTSDGFDGKYRSTDDNDSSKQQQPRKLLTTTTINDKSNYNHNKRTMTSNSDSDDDVLPSPNNNHSNSRSSLKKKKINVNYKRGNVINKSNKRSKYDEEEYDDDGEDSEGDDDDDINHNTPHRVQNNKKKNQGVPLRELVPEKDMSPTLSECLTNSTGNGTNSTSSSYNNFLLENGQASSNADLVKQVEIIVKDNVWCQYKLPDVTDYLYSSRFSSLILKRLGCEVKTMNRRGQEMWTRVMPMVKAEYQITRSTVTQAMKTIFIGKYCNNK